MLKSDFHLHAGIDEHHKLDHSPKDLINLAYKEGYEVLAITNHSTITYSKSLAGYAKKRGILLIPGMEAPIEGKDVLILNATPRLKQRIRTFADLERYKDENILVTAPHPFYPGSKSLMSKLIKNIDLFDAIEYSHFYIQWFNKFNEMAMEVAHRHNKPMMGTSDCHMIKQFGTTYSLVDSDKDMDSIFAAIRKHNVRVMTRPLPTLKAMVMLAKIYFYY